MQGKRLLLLLVGAFLFLVGAQERAMAAKTGASGEQKAIFASGCFWKPQYVFSHETGVTGTQVGYCGGSAAKPTYKQVCTGSTGHAESVLVTYDPKKTTYEALVRKFFSIHNPTQLNRQGPDVGTQYRSAIFYLDDAQRKTATKVMSELQKESPSQKIVTAIKPAGKFWKAEDYHQNYFEKHGQVCH